MNEAIKTLLDWETRHHLWRRSVLDYPVWAHLRLGWYHRLLESVLPARGDVSESRRRLWGRAPASAHDLMTKLLPAIRRRDIWVLGNTAYRRTQTAGSPQNIFVGHLQRQLGGRLLFLETNPNNAPRLAEPNVVYLDLLRDSLRIAGTRTARMLPERLAEPFASLPELQKSGREALKEALFGKAWWELGRLLLALGRPRAVFVLCAYDQHIPFQLAIRQCAVPLIEIQHGVIHENHPGYIFGEHDPGLHAPDHLLVFGDHYGELVERGSRHWRGRWSVAGHPWLSAKRQQFSRHETEELVVIFGQNMPAVQQQVRACATGLRARLPKAVRIVVKPHPAEKNSREVYAELPALGIEIAALRADSYELLGRCRMAVSVFSTIAVEALAFGCQSVVLRSKHWFEDIERCIEAGMIQVADGAEDVARLYHGWAKVEQEHVARRFFGIGRPELDFERLIAELRANRSLEGNRRPVESRHARDR
jgi:hypothetical protein